MAEKKMKAKKAKNSKLGDSEVREEELITTEAPSLRVSDDNDLQKEKKKKKKKSSSQEEEVVVEEQSVSNESSSTKDEKKKKKRKNSEPEESGQDRPLNGHGTDETKSDEKPKKKKKRQNENVNSIPSLGNYIPHADVESMSLASAEAYRQEHSLALLPTEAADFYKPITSFAQLTPSLQDYCPEVLQYLEAKKFPNPSPIQSQCWPILLTGRDAIGIAATGSGKTLAFLIPALLSMAKENLAGSLNASKRGNSTPHPRMLILAPTRELAMQSHQVVLEVGSAKGVCIYGGVPKPAQKAELRANGGVDVVVATPGRLEDLLEENALSLSDVRYLVLDEADRMLDDGFEPAIRRIIAKCPASTPMGDGRSGRQTVMFSATWPEEIRALAETFLRHDAIRVTVGSEDLCANHRVQQIVECIDARNKDRRLMELLANYHKSRKNRCLIFVLYKREAASLQTTLTGRGYNVTAIHGDMNQYDRTAALEEFKSGRIPLLIATDVAARGLDIPQVEYVLNYSFPLTVEDYVHRIGRTGRGGASGISHTFFTDFDKGLAGGLVGVLQDANQPVPQEIYQYPLITKKKQSKLYGDFGPKTELAGKKATKITFDE